MTVTLAEYSLVAIGSMNPPIHHPQFYRRVGLITDDELQASLESKDMIFVPPVSQFSFNGVQVACQENRWQIKSRSLDISDRVRNITAEIFDTHLPHTPISAVGFNFNYSCEYDNDAPGTIAGIVTKALDFGVSKPSSAEIKVSDTSSAFHVNVTVRPVSSHTIIAATNIHFPVKDFIEEGKAFQLKDFLDSYFESELSGAQNRAQKIVAQLPTKD